MFELGKKEGDAAQTSSTQRPSSAPAATTSPAPARSAGGNQFAVIGRSIQIQGDVKGEEDLVIEGNVSGTVELKNNSLTIGKEGAIRADVYARSITVEGTTEGDLYASERISIKASATVRGNLVAPSIALEDGARFKGSVEMDQQAVDKALGGIHGNQGSQSGRHETISSKSVSEAKPIGQPSTAGAGG